MRPYGLGKALRFLKGSVVFFHGNPFEQGRSHLLAKSRVSHPLDEGFYRVFHLNLLGPSGDKGLKRASDGCLFPGDARQIIPEHIGVFQRKGGHHRDVSRRRPSSVQTPTQPGLQKQHANIVAACNDGRNEKGDLEKRERMVRAVLHRFDGG